MVKQTGRGPAVKRPGVLSKALWLGIVLGVGAFSPQIPQGTAKKKPFVRIHSGNNSKIISVSASAMKENLFPK